MPNKQTVQIKCSTTTRIFLSSTNQLPDWFHLPASSDKSPDVIQKKNELMFKDIFVGKKLHTAKLIAQDPMTFRKCLECYLKKHFSNRGWIELLFTHSCGLGECRCHPEFHPLLIRTEEEHINDSRCQVTILMSRSTTALEFCHRLLSSNMDHVSEDLGKNNPRSEEVLYSYKREKKFEFLEYQDSFCFDEIKTMEEEMDDLNPMTTDTTDEDVIKLTKDVAFEKRFLKDICSAVVPLHVEAGKLISQWKQLNIETFGSKFVVLQNDSVIQSQMGLLQESKEDVNFFKNLEQKKTEQKLVNLDDCRRVGEVYTAILNHICAKSEKHALQVRSSVYTEENYQKIESQFETLFEKIKDITYKMFCLLLEAKKLWQNIYDMIQEIEFYIKYAD